MVRIFTVCHPTQLMVVLHLRRHLQLPKAREYLVWATMGNVTGTRNFMRDVIAGAGFDDVLDISDFECLKLRTQGAVAWWFESARRFRCDATTVRHWMAKNGIMDSDVELWADDPIHFNVTFFKGLLRTVRHIKVPHCFNLEDKAILGYRRRLEEKWRRVPRLKSLLYWPWLKLISGVDNGPDRGLAYDVGYTFEQPSCWATCSIDVSHLISIRAFKETFECLPQSIKAETEETLASAKAEGKPLILLLLFGLGSSEASRVLYQNALERIFREQHHHFEGCVLAVKAHPSGVGEQEEMFFRWLRNNSFVKVVIIRSPLNLELILPQISFEYVLAGPCGALAILKRMQTSRSILLPEIMADMIRAFPEEREAYELMVEGIEIW
jgi:hypothetical protein